MDYRKLELQLRRAAEKALRRGWMLEQGEFFPREWQGLATCCALGAVGIDAVEYESTEVEYDWGEYAAEHHLLVEDASEAWKTLGISEDQMADIACGFDAANRNKAIDGALYDIGANIRRIYCDDNGQVE